MANDHRRLEVAVFGFYRYGNFGDDLAAVIFCRRLKELGIGVRVYGLCEPYSKAFGLTVAETVEDLLDGVDMVLFGGGGVLVSHRRPSWYRIGMLGHLPELGKTCEKLIAIATSRRIPILGLSIGGDGVVGRPLFPPHKRTFVKSARLISVRNRADLAVLEYHGRRGVYYPDIVWQTASCFPSMPRQRGRTRVGINLYLANLRGEGLLYIAALWLISRRRRDVDFVFIETANASRNRFGAIALPQGRNVRRYMFHHPTEDLSLISSLDMVISSRLHLGIAGMSYGVPFLSVKGEAKTQASMEELGLSQMCLGSGDIVHFTRLLWNCHRFNRLIEDPVLPDVPALAHSSSGHLREFAQIVEAIQQRAR